MNNTDKHKHMDYIQSVITRMATNSFKIKGWAVTIASALVALSIGRKENGMTVVIILPILMFWFLDSYYLWQERLYRGLYNKVRLLDSDSVDYDMAADSKYRKLGVIRRYSVKIKEFALAIFSISEILFYMVLIVLVIVCRNVY